MKSITLLSALLLIPGFATAQAPESAGASAAALQPKVIEWRRDFHRHPELGNREFRSSERIAEHLKSLGLQVETGVAHTGVVALLEGARPGPRLALRADMDALPVTEQTGLPFASTATGEFRGEQVGVMHACGHDGHMAILLGVAEALAERRQSLAGSVLFIFQPSEEGPPEGEEGGAKLMLAEGLFQRYAPDAIVGLHLLSNFPVGTVAVRPGPIMAESDSFQIVVEGRQTHGSRPWSGVDPVLVGARIIDGLQSIVSRRVDLTRSPAVVSVGAVKAGIRYNIIPDRMELLGTIRSFEDDVREAIFADVQQIAEHTAQAHGASASVKIDRHTVVLVNDSALSAQLRPSLERALGADQVLTAPMSTVAEDFAYFAEEIPGYYYFVGSTPLSQDPATAPTNHSPLFDIDEDALQVGVHSLLQLSLDYLGANTQP
ncbi:MAG: amidohydrolase [Lysobacterales bacterium]